MRGLNNIRCQVGIIWCLNNIRYQVGDILCCFDAIEVTKMNYFAKHLFILIRQVCLNNFEKYKFYEGSKYLFALSRGLELMSFLSAIVFFLFFIEETRN